MTERALENINVFFIQRLQTFFLSRFLRFLTFFIFFLERFFLHLCVSLPVCVWDAALRRKQAVGGRPPRYAPHV